MKKNPKQKIAVCFRSDSALRKNKRTNVVLVGIFENAQKKLSTAKNGQKAVFWIWTSKIIPALWLLDLF